MGGEIEVVLSSPVLRMGAKCRLVSVASKRGDGGRLHDGSQHGQTGDSSPLTKADFSILLARTRVSMYHCTPTL